MKLSLLPQSYFARRGNSFRSSPSETIFPADAPNPKPYPGNLSWLILHCLCCLVSLILGFRFSHVVFFLLFSSATTSLYSSTLTTITTTTLTTTTTTTLTHSLTNLPILTSTTNLTASRTAVNRHGVLIRPLPHPNPEETLRAHQIIDRVQKEQRMQYGFKKPRPIIVVTPTYIRTFQALYLTGLMHSLKLVPYDLTWVVVEGGGVTNETASILDRSQLNYIHIPFNKGMPRKWVERGRTEAQMRLHALRVVREHRLDGIVVFADESNIHSTELFDEIQRVKWMGALSVGILTQSGVSENNEDDIENLLVPIHGPACDSSGKLVSLPKKLEWAGFVMNSRSVWKDVEGRPDWIKNLDDVGMTGEEIDNPLALLKEASSVEPLGNCGKKVLLWWLRAEARADSKFPAGWKIDASLEITVPAKRMDRRSLASHSKHKPAYMMLGE